MAWVAPITFVDGMALTAATLTTYLRDNMLETEVAKASRAGSWFISDGPNRIIERVPNLNRQDSTGYTTSTEFDDLRANSDGTGDAVLGPQLTVTTGDAALIFMSASMSNAQTGSFTAMSYGISGATERDPQRITTLALDGVPAGNGNHFMVADFITTLTPGDNTFYAKYYVGSGTGQYQNRVIAVLPF